jgi:hypothetical protein
MSAAAKGRLFHTKAALRSLSRLKSQFRISFVPSVAGKSFSWSRNHDCSQPPPRIRTSGIPASGSCLR